MESNFDDVDMTFDIEMIRPYIKCNIPDQKQCGHCKQIKNIDQFNKSADSIDRKAPMCKRCAKENRHKHRDLQREANHRRTARKSATIENVFTEEDRLALLKEYDGRCAYCGSKPDKLEMDHVIPLSRGGKHTKINIVPACFDCNRRKGGRTPEQAEMELRKSR